MKLKFVDLEKYGFVMEPLNSLEREAFKNRRLLKRVMEKTQFINHAPEWWHWSYDK